MTISAINSKQAFGAKNAVPYILQGIKIVDSESKKLALEKLQADSKEHEMEIDEPVKPKKTIRKTKKTKKKVPADEKMQD